jgi:hypothetical protein
MRTEGKSKDDGKVLGDKRLYGRGKKQEEREQRRMKTLNQAYSKTAKGRCNSASTDCVFLKNMNAVRTSG